MDIGEMGDLVRILLKESVHYDVLHEMIKIEDKDGDGYLNIEEFINLV